MFKSFRVALCIWIPLGALGSYDLAAQSPGDELRSEFSELGGLLNAFDVAHAATLEQLVMISEGDEGEEGRNALREALARQANMTMAEMMAMHGGGSMPEMAMHPFGELEARALAELTELVGGDHSAADARSAFSNNATLTQRAADVIQRGREFQARIFDIYADAGISDKFASVNAAVSEYLDDSELAVPASPKSPVLLYGHPFASAFKTGYPELSGLVWAAQWLELASLEPIMLGGGRDTVERGLDTTIERFRGKLERMQGMSMLPTEIPMVPAISPLLLSRHEEAAVIIDNLNMLETIIADLLAHPDVQDRPGSVDTAVSEFTDQESNLATRSDYLLSALRTGIFDQGGPALGELARSERNRTRMEMEMGGHAVMPGMN